MSEQVTAARVPNIPEPIDRAFGPLMRLARWQSAGGVLLLLTTVAAMAWANSPWAESYTSLWRGGELSAKAWGIGFAKSPEWWINDALMAIFFFLVGLEIKREVLMGELSSARKAMLPIIAAAGGMAVPGLIYAALNWGEPSVRGWGVPVATDIAFALGVLSLLGSRVPPGLRVFLATLAIADDLGALLVIAIFYTEKLSLGNLGVAGGVWLLMVTLNRVGVRNAWAFACFGLALWYFIYQAGVHPTIAGVLGAATIPVRSRAKLAAFVPFADQSVRALSAAAARAGNPRAGVELDGHGQAVAVSLEDACRKLQTPLQRLEGALIPWVAFVIVPVFALANAGVPVTGGVSGLASDRIAIGVILGLVVGKPVGIFVASWAAVRLGLGVLPAGVNWVQIAAAGVLGGIGFTMSLFIANLAFPDPAMLNHAKLGVLGGSAVAGVVGLLLLHWGTGGRGQADGGHA